ncbi:uncharacterized protein LOC127410434 isoform X1 [Myxocyprinus asiaticus]|uniref:uncharacterized protein LOC127410434 isoform X1 n=1 Tax=Myxocyprinus asiaticus TaxID=70543 RepID=UPI0022235CCD|nr:uncharacterized protein LOC127410434 isoform X1 [Myxocyprinus asiaticus]XP_051501671.1 uncharacterized protein LOC127410434 isoform X1 [Myxocyprinus asiaticus]
MRTRLRTGAALMAESVRSPFDYREPPTLDSDGDGSKPPPPRGRVCGRKRKGTPVKVCDRAAYVTEDEEESLSEHSYSPGRDRLTDMQIDQAHSLCHLVAGDEQYPEGAEDRLPPPGSPFYLTDPSQLCVPELGEEGASGVRGPVLFHPPPNCRIREVHCGSQVRLVVIAIRDIAKGEEITVDYSLTDWGENPMGFHSSVSPPGFECGFNPENNIKKEEDPGSLPLSLTVSDYLTPSWSLSPSSSPMSHSEASDSDREEEEEDDDDEDDEDLEELRGRMMRRRKKLKTSASVKKKATPRPLSFTCPAPSSPSPFQQPLAPPMTNINNNININIGHGASGALSHRQHCPYCGRHFRSLARHLEKHHDQQPEVRAAMELSHHHTPPQPTTTTNTHTFSSPAQPSSSLGPSLFSQERDSVSSPSKSGAVSFSLSLSPPTSSNTSKKTATSISTTKKGAAPAASTVNKSSPVTPNPPTKRGRPPKKGKEKKQEELQQAKEEAPPTPGQEGDEEDKEEDELNMKEGSVDEKNGEMESSHRSHMPPLLSSLSTLVLYLRQQQHSSFLSLSRSPSLAESWRLLCHSSLALLILYNRHRECEVAKLTIQDYRDRSTPSPNSVSPLESTISPFERHVLCHLPRVGVMGKRGRIQPLILPPNSEACLDLLLKTSADVGVDPESPYVFSRPYHSPATPLRGTDLLRGLARTSGAKNPTALTAPRARRQVAILTQLLLLEEGVRPAGTAVKRLEDFLQKEYHVTQSCTRIGQDPALMSRVGRVVLYGEREGVLFRGMSLQHICLELDVMSGNSADSFSDDTDGESEKNKEKAEVVKKGRSSARRPMPKKRSRPHVTPATPSPSGAHKRRSSQVKSGKRGVLKRPWSEAERVAVETHLKRNIVELRVPAKADCERCLQHCPLLVTNQRDWRAIKFYCHNRIQLLKKQGRREGTGASIC